MMDSTLAELIEAMRNGRYGDEFLPNPPITMAEIEEAEKELPFPLPKFYKAFLLLSNGGVFNHLTLCGIHPTEKSPSEIFHPITLESYEQLTAETNVGAWLRRGYRYSMDSLMSQVNLVKASTHDSFADVDFGYGEIEYRDKFVAVGGIGNGDMFVLQPNDETLYAWIADCNEVDSEFYGSLLDVIKEEIISWEELEATRKRPKPMWEKIGRWWNREG